MNVVMQVDTEHYRNLCLMFNEMYESLLNAIIIQGYNDYLDALKKNDRKRIAEVEDSFKNNPWLFSYYEVEPETLLRKARKEIENGIFNKRTILQDV